MTFHEEWKREQEEWAIKTSKDYEDRDITTEEDLSNLIAELMCDHGPDGHCDGHNLIAKVIWKKLGVKK